LNAISVLRDLLRGVNDLPGSAIASTPYAGL